MIAHKSSHWLPWAAKKDGKSSVLCGFAKGISAGFLANLKPSEQHPGHPGGYGKSHVIAVIGYQSSQLNGPCFIAHSYVRLLEGNRLFGVAKSNFTAFQDTRTMEEKSGFLREAAFGISCPDTTIMIRHNPSQTKLSAVWHNACSPGATCRCRWWPVHVSTPPRTDWSSVAMALFSLLPSCFPCPRPWLSEMTHVMTKGCDKQRVPEPTQWDAMGHGDIVPQNHTARGELVFKYMIDY